MKALYQKVVMFWFFGKGAANSFATTFCVWCFKKNIFLYYILLIGQFSLSDCFYFWTYWTIFLLQMLVSQVVTSSFLKSVLLFWSSSLSAWPWNYNTNRVNIQENYFLKPIKCQREELSKVIIHRSKFLNNFLWLSSHQNKNMYLKQRSFCVSLLRKIKKNYNSKFNQKKTLLIVKGFGTWLPHFFRVEFY